MIASILQNIPPEAEITRIEFEGPRLALYTRNPKFLHQNTFVISEIVSSIKKRVVVRTDKSIRKKEEEAKTLLVKLIPKNAEVVGMFFDEVLGEATVEVKYPKVLSTDASFDSFILTEKSGWKTRVKKAPGLTSTSIQNVNYALKSAIDERERFYKSTGEKIFRPKLMNDSAVTLSTLGGFREVGRSSMIVKTPESKLLLDCGVHPGTRNSVSAYPRLDWADVDFSELDAVIISHSHLDHMGFLPVLYKYGYDGPIYLSEPTLPLMNLLLTDSIKVASMEGGRPLFDLRDLREVIRHCIPLPYGLVTDVSPDVKLVLNNSGHILGSSTVHLHIGEGLHNIVYTGDLKYSRSQLLESCVWNYPRIETLIMESTYGAKEDIMPSREDVEARFVHTINETLKEGGKVLIPVPAVGRAQEIMLVLDHHMRQGALAETPIFAEGMISEATAIHNAFPEYLARELRTQILENDTNPFVSDYFTIIDHPSNRSEALQEGPAIIMATSGMLEGGPVIQYFLELANDEKHKMIFVSYQISGTLGRRILDGARQASLLDDKGKIKIVDISCKVEKIEGFSGHSDYNQLLRFVGKVRPKLRRVLVNHGERRKTENLAHMISRLFRVQAEQPSVQETLKLC